MRLCVSLVQLWKVHQEPDPLTGAEPAWIAVHPTICFAMKTQWLCYCKDIGRTSCLSGYGGGVLKVRMGTSCAKMQVSCYEFVWGVVSGGRQVIVSGDSPWLLWAGLQMDKSVFF